MNPPARQPGRGRRRRSPRERAGDRDDADETGQPVRRLRTEVQYVNDPLTHSTAEMRQIQPVDSKKEYICPGCNQEIRAGTGHVVIVPLNSADMRRHWHRPCFERARQHGLR